MSRKRRPKPKSKGTPMTGIPFGIHKWAVRKGHLNQVRDFAAMWGAKIPRTQGCTSEELTRWGWRPVNIRHAEAGGYAKFAGWVAGWSVAAKAERKAPTATFTVWVPGRAVEISEYLTAVGTPPKRIEAMLRSGPNTPELKAELALAVLAGHTLPGWEQFHEAFDPLFCDLEGV